MSRPETFEEPPDLDFPIKVAYKNIARDSRENGAIVTKENFGIILEKACQKALTESVIKSGFSKTGNRLNWCPITGAMTTLE